MPQRSIILFGLVKRPQSRVQKQELPKGRLNFFDRPDFVFDFCADKITHSYRLNVVAERQGNTKFSTNYVCTPVRRSVTGIMGRRCTLHVYLLHGYPLFSTVYGELSKPTGSQSAILRKCESASSFVTQQS